MSEVKLNLVDAHTMLSGTIHGSVADSAVAALSAEPETIAELEAALARYIKPDEIGPFASFRSSSEIDLEPWDAGLVVIDLAARVVASESTYSQPGPEGHVYYHDGTQLTDIPISYHLPDDWRFVNSLEAYNWSAPRRRAERQANPPFDARAVLYGLPLIEFIVKSVTELREKGMGFSAADEEAQEALAREIMCIHANWLTTPRADLRRRSPRDVMLAKQNLINLDMDSRCMQWTLLGEGPPCLAPDSFAYRYAGFGTHEWVVYYELVRYLLWRAIPRSEVRDEKLETAGLDNYRTGRDSDRVLARRSEVGEQRSEEKVITTLDELKANWLEQPQDEYGGRIPAIILDNERRRLPITMTAAQIMIDENCECCRMMALDAEMGGGPTFWDLDGCNMEEEFAFSTCLTREEWEAEVREREEFNRKFERDMDERRQRLARGEIPDDELWSADDPF